MPKPKVMTEPQPERVILLLAGESGSGKSFLVANLTNALIFDTDLGGGLAYADERIRRNGSERIEVGSYLDVIEELKKRQRQLQNITTLAIDHLSTLQQEAVIRHNPQMVKDFGQAGEKGTREWRKIRDLVRWGGFHLFCTAHLKAKWEQEKVTGITTDASKNIEADFQIVLYARRAGLDEYPSTAMRMKWRRDPDDLRGRVPAQFPLTLDKIVSIHGYPLEGARVEVPMATPEQVSQIANLLTIVKLPEGQVEKWLAKAKAESWEEFTQADLQKCIDYLQAILKTMKPQE